MPESTSANKTEGSTDANALSELLDEALGDFSRAPKQQPKCSDDDLDKFLAPLDSEATKKAAQNFENMLKNFAIPQAFENSNSTPQPSTTAASHQFLSSLLGIDQFLNDEGVEPEVRMITETILKDCFTKDVILPLIKTFRDIIIEYLAEEGLSITEEENNNLLKQKELFNELIQSYESASDPQTDEETEQQNALWIKLKDLGEVPQVLVTRFESKLQADGAMSGLPGLGGALGADPSQCSIM